MNKNEDIAWVTRCALFDDRRAFACLVDKYQVRLKRFFLNLTGGDPVLSDDLRRRLLSKFIIICVVIKACLLFRHGFIE